MMLYKNNVYSVYLKAVINIIMTCLVTSSVIKSEVQYSSGPIISVFNNGFIVVIIFIYLVCEVVKYSILTDSPVKIMSEFSVVSWLN